MFDFIPFSSQIFNELSRKRQRLPTLNAGISRFLAFPSSVFQCIPKTDAASWRFNKGSKFGDDFS
jgi:hypothetical protein